MTQKNFYIVRGLPGAGKNTFIKAVVPGEQHVYGADDFLVNEQGEYVWSKEKHMDAVRTCYEKIENAMRAGEPRIFLHSVLDEKAHVEEYLALGQKYGYRTFTVIVENRHGGQTAHGVPPETMQKFRSHFDISL